MIGFPGASACIAEEIDAVPQQEVPMSSRKSIQDSRLSGERPWPRDFKGVDIVIVGLGWTGGILAQGAGATRASTIVALERGKPRDTEPGFHDADDPRRAAVRAAPRADAERRARHAHLPQQFNRDCAADAAARLVPARRRRRRRRRALERPDLALVAVRPRAMRSAPVRATARTRSRRHDTCRTGASPTTSSSPTTTGSKSCAACRARPAICAARRSTAAMRSKGRAQRRVSQPAADRSRRGRRCSTRRRAELGYHPFPAPAGQHVAAPTSTRDGVHARASANIAAICERFGCEANAKASPQFTVIPLAAAEDELRAAHRRRGVKDRSTTAPARRRRRHLCRHAAARSTSSRPSSSCSAAYVASTTCTCCCCSGIGEPYDPATGKGVVGRNYCLPDRGSGATCSSRTRMINPFMGAGALAHGDRRFQRRQFRPRGARLLRRRRLSRRLEHRRAADRDPGRCRPARRAGVREWKKRGQARLQPRARHRHIRAAMMAYRAELSRSRSDLSGRARPSADAHDLQLHTTTSTSCRTIIADNASKIAKAMKPASASTKRAAPGRY